LLVSDQQRQKDVMAKIFTNLSGIPVRMVSYGGSQHNISILISREHKEKQYNY